MTGGASRATFGSLGKIETREAASTRRRAGDRGGRDELGGGAGERLRPHDASPWWSSRSATNARGPDLAPLVRCRPLENRGSERRSAMDAAIATKLSEDLARVDFGRERRRELSTPRPGAVRESRATSVRLATFATLARLGRFGMSATRKPRFRRGIRDPRDASRARPSISGDHAWNRSLPATCELRSRRCPGKRRKHSGLMGLSRVARSPSRSQVAVPSSCGQFQITPVRSRVRVPHRPLHTTLGEIST